MDLIEIESIMNLFVMNNHKAKNNFSAIFI